MRTWVLDRQAETDLQAQLDYLIEHGVPRTRLVVWYRFTDTELQVARIWHTAQDRQSAPR